MVYVPFLTGLAIIITYIFTGLSAIALEVYADKLEDQWQCVRAISFYERKYNLPHNLLYAVASVESGQWINEYKIAIPWPWTLNVEGRSYFFKSKDEAAHFLKKTISKGIENVDIGCGQINWKHHGRHFKDPLLLLDPVYNIAYAAYFLVSNFTETKNWRKATALYHSKTVILGANYFNKVNAQWINLSKKNHGYTIGSDAAYLPFQRIVLPRLYNDMKNTFKEFNQASSISSSAPKTEIRTSNIGTDINQAILPWPESTQSQHRNIPGVSKVGNNLVETLEKKIPQNARRVLCNLVETR